MEYFNGKKNPAFKKKKTVFVFLLIFTSLSFSSFSQLKGANQDDAEDTYYDPFIDYNEFDTSEDEEDDINFFTHGRFLSVAIALGPRLFTQTLGKISSTNVGAGVLLDYFFNLRTSLQAGILTGSNSYSFFTPSNQPIRGAFHLTSFGVGVKYYFDPQNLVQVLARLNPYSMFGYAMVRRTTGEDRLEALAKEDASSFRFGGGMEINFNKRKTFVGLQITYNLILFSDEKSEVFINDGTEATGIFLNGDLVSLLLLLGINF